ncbi:hypothetical protein RND81_03G089300 [Saponaria officinalis]|uniref:AB hydrolase-1 domain-containing protein n=1 Tax=Saponaria officinalis TaxID=3572 RepID=A0AAW1M5D7_SAPOF
MGNICNSSANNNKKHNTTTTQKRQPYYRRSTSVPSSTTNSRGSRMRSSSTRRESISFEDHVLHEQALAAAAAIILQQQRQNIGSLPFDRSVSLRHQPFSKKQQNQSQVTLPRSSSSRARSSTDTLLQPHQLLHQDPKLEDLPTNHFVLVHGGGFGAWCWYKTIALLEESGYKVTAIDLAGSGIHSFDTNAITSLSQYVKPLTEFLQKLADTEKVILVGHDIGGCCISLAMEMFPSKVSKAIFVAAIMLIDGQSALDIFSQQVDSMDLLQQAQILQYGNGNNHTPTAIDLDKSFLKDLLFNQSPTKVVNTFNSTDCLILNP